MTIGKIISENRKRRNMTQGTLAQKLGVTNQAVSKWELDQACPDIQLLPVLADIFGITLDELFGRKAPSVEHHAESPFGISFADLWDKFRDVIPREPLLEDDDALRIVLYRGQKLLKHCPAAEKLSFEYTGPALNISSAVCVICGDVEGSVDAGSGVSCGNVGGDVDAGSIVNCGNVAGNVDAGASVCCADVGGDVDAGSHVTCGSVAGSVDAGGPVSIGK